MQLTSPNGGAALLATGSTAMDAAKCFGPPIVSTLRYVPGLLFELHIKALPGSPAVIVGIYEATSDTDVNVRQARELAGAHLSSPSRLMNGALFGSTTSPPVHSVTEAAAKEHLYMLGETYVRASQRGLLIYDA